MKKLWRRGALALFYGLASSLFSPFATHATILQAGSGPEEDARLEREAHITGTKFPSVVSIYMLGRKDWPPVTSGTGVFIGATRDGRKGLILTAAHIFNYQPKEGRALGYQRIAVGFGPDLTYFQAGNAEKVFLHPRFAAGAPAYLKGTEAEIAQTPFGHDLAIIQFDLPPHAKAMGDLGVTPADLDERGEHLAHPSLEAKTVGFGVFGTNSGTLVPQNVKVHAGDTLVSRGSLRGHNLIMNWSPMSPEASELLEAKTVAPSLFYRFATLEGSVEVREESGSGPQVMQSHARQTLVASGDSGGPLFITTPEGPKVAGICSRLEHCRVLRGDTGEKSWAVASLWEPVVDYLPWIQEIRHGMEERALVLEPAGGQWECRGRAGGPGSGDAGKIEAKDPEADPDPPPPGKCRRPPCVIL